MRVTLINQYYPPDASATAPLASELARAIAQRGHVVTVIAGRPSYETLARRPWRLFTREQEGHVIVKRVGSSAFDRRRMGGRIANYVSYLAMAGWPVLFARCDILLVMTDPPMASIVAALVAKLRRKPLVINVRDLHPDMAVTVGLLRPGLLSRVWDALQTWALRRAARVIVLGADMRRRVVDKGVEPERVAIVRDGAPLPATLPPRDHPISQQVRNGFEFVVLHAGNVGFACAWEALLGAARSMESERVGFVFVGDGAAMPALRTEAERLRNVRLEPFRPVAEVPHVLQAGDVHVVSVRENVEGLVVPSKLYPVLAAGRPPLVVAAAGSDAAQLVAESGCGWVADPSDPEAIAAAIREAMDDSAELRKRGERARALASHFQRPRLLAEVAEVVEGEVESATASVSGSRTARCSGNA
jgi:colanic acid biosynthesis glycosyl transferase WcaI